MKKKVAILTILILMIFVSLIGGISFLIKRQNDNVYRAYNKHSEIQEAVSLFEDFEYYDYGVGPGLESFSFQMDISEEDYNNVIYGTRGYLDIIVSSGSRIEEDGEFFTKLYDGFVQDDMQYLSLDDEVNRIISEEEVDVVWNKELLYSYTYGCEEESIEECKKKKDDITVYLLRAFTKFGNEKILNSGHLMKFKSNDSSYSGFLYNVGEKYETENASSYEMPIIPFKKFENYDDLQELLFFSFNQVWGEYETDKPIVFTGIERFLFAVGEGEEISFVPVFVLYGNQGDEELYGIVDLIDYSKLFETVYLDNEEVLQESVIVDPVESITLNEKYKLVSYIPDYKILVKEKFLIWDVYSLKEVRLNSISVGVNPEFVTGYEANSNEYVYDNQVLDSLRFINVSPVNGKVSIEFAPETFWLVNKQLYGYDQDEKQMKVTVSEKQMLRDAKDNGIEVVLCLEFNDILIKNQVDNETCTDTYNYYLPLPDYSWEE